LRVLSNGISVQPGKSHEANLSSSGFDLARHRGVHHADEPVVAAPRRTAGTMSVVRGMAVVSVVLGGAIGSLLDLNAPAAKAASAEYQVLAADFHVHTFFGDGALPPWEIAAEARRRGLDVIAVTNHNQMVAARLGAWLVGRGSELLLLKGEEITAPNYHLVAIGISHSIGWRSSGGGGVAARQAPRGGATGAP